MNTYTAWKQYEFEIEANSLDEAYEKLKNIKISDHVDWEAWVDDKDKEDE